jgi:hypothetical protein
VDRFRKSIPGAALFALLGLLAFRVEDGQFTREYSRIYTTLVLTIGGLLLLMVVAGLYRITRHRAQNAF